MAGTRLSGLMSGMDTESIIEQLLEGRKKKVDVVRKTQKTINYKQEAWKSLNTKLKSLQTKFVSNMRYTSSYMKKTTKVSNPSAASIITSGNATNGVQSLEIRKLAKTAYLTGGELGDGKQGYTALSTMADLGIDFSENESMTFAVADGNNSLDIEVTAETTISDVLTKLKEFGLNASFDEKNQRMFVSSKQSGAAHDFTFEARGAGSEAVMSALGLVVDPDDDSGKGATKVAGSDSEILLNGAKFTNSSNVFEINGLTITALSQTKEGEAITVTTQDDTDGIYDMVKNFFKEYNSVINEMDKLYNAPDSKLEPLTDEEKYALSDKEIEDWEKKLTDSILRKDSAVSEISMAMRKAMSQGVEVNGKQMYLSDFGIETLGWTYAAENERNAYHINGDPDDGETSGKDDKLRAAIAADPETVVSFFTKLTSNLYDEMYNKSKSVQGYRSYGSFYDDKRMTTEFNDYKSKIAQMEQKLNAYEDKWYKKFSKMETAMAKMQKNTNAVTSLFGGM